MNEALRAKIANMLLKIFPEGSDLPLQLVEECLNEPHLLSVYEESSGVAMDVVILNALMKGKCIFFFGGVFFVLFFFFFGGLDIWWLLNDSNF